MNTFLGILGAAAVWATVIGVGWILARYVDTR